MLKKILLSILALLLSFIVIGLFLPQSVNVERSVVIEQPLETLFKRLNSFETFNTWSPWHGIDPKTQYHYEGPESGVGAKMSWQSDHPNVGSGSQIITKSIPFKRIDTLLDFGSEGEADAYFELRTVESGIQVTWGMDTDFGWSIPGRYIGLFFDNMLGPDFEKGLNNLKAVMEDRQ